MAIPGNKNDLIADIERSYQKVRTEFRVWDEKDAFHKNMPGQVKDSQVSAHNLASYLLGWNETVIGWINSYDETGKIPHIYTSGYGNLALKFYEMYRDLKYEKLLERLDASVEEVLRLLQLKNNDELYGVTWYTASSSKKEYTLGKLVQLNTSSPYKNVYKRLRSKR